LTGDFPQLPASSGIALQWINSASGERKNKARRPICRNNLAYLISTVKIFESNLPVSFAIAHAMSSFSAIRTRKNGAEC
jgi:hypothetical protein